MFDIPLKVVCLFSTATHLQTSDTRVMLICFSCRSETSGTKARFSANSGTEVRDVSKVFTQTLYQRMRGSSALMLFQVSDVCLRGREWPSKQPLIGCNTHYCMRRTFYCNISLSLACTPQLPLPSPPPRNTLLQQGVGAAGAPALTRLRRDTLLC